MVKPTQQKINDIENEGRKIRFDLFSKLCDVQEGHPGSILSIFDIVNALYLGNILRIEKHNNLNDVFIMSKGHAAAVQYPYLVRKGIIETSDWVNWGLGHSNLRVFANNHIPGIDVTSGSLGHGLGIAAGMALAHRMDKVAPNIFVVISEGELYEGSTWEALLFLAHHELAKIKIIIDVNQNMTLGRPEEHIRLESIDEKLAAFRLQTKRIDGHDYQQIFDGLNFLTEAQHQPRVLIADTIKGKGVSFMEGTKESHYWVGLSQDKIDQMLKDLAV
jgi:transketolase